MLGWPCLEELRQTSVITQNPVRKRPLGRPRRHLERCHKKNVEQMGGDAN